MNNKLLDDARAAGFSVEHNKIYADCDENYNFSDITDKLAKFVELQKPQWISVNDGLPDHIGSYIGYAGNTIYWMFFNSKKQWYNTDEQIRGVTHWMPLPKAPTDKDT